MNRTTLDFLIPMFPFAHFSAFTIVVINQTTAHKMLESEYPTVRIVNSFEKGLSKSRNLALQITQGKIILLTDDDVVFINGFENILLKKFNENKDAAAIQFRVEDMLGKAFKEYRKHSGILSTRGILYTMSIEMAYNRNTILKSRIEFDENFGLGAAFPLGEEHIFLGDLKKAGFSILYHNEVIARHKAEKNSDNITSKRRFETIGAYYVRMFPKTFYFWLVLFFLLNLKNGRVKLHQVAGCFINAVKGKKQYLKLIDENNNR